MKVLHLSHGCRPEMNGGVETYLDELVREQRRRGIEVELLAGSHELRDEPTIEVQEIDDLRVHRFFRDDLYFDLWSKSYHVGAERAIEGLILRLRPDIVHVHQWIRLTSNLVEIAARHGIPAVVTTHDVYTSCPRCFRVRRDDSSCTLALSVENCRPCVPVFGHESSRELELGIELYRDQYRAELETAAAVLVASPATRRMITSTTGIDENVFEVFPLPYARRFESLPRTPRSPAENEPVRFAYWGVLTYRKGAQVLVRAFAELCRRGGGRPAELHLFGGIDTDELESELRQDARGLPVHFHGRYEYDQLAAAGLDVGVFPMLCFETWGFVLDECYELGLPCITTHNGALSERAGDAALRVPQADVGALADAMQTLLDPTERARRRTEIPPLPPTISAHVERLSERYEAAIARGPRPGAGIPPSRRARLLELQRESALPKNIPEGGPH